MLLYALYEHKKNKGKKQKLKSRFNKLYGKSSDAVCVFYKGVFIDKAYVTLYTVTAAAQKTAYSAKGVKQRSDQSRKV